MKNSLCLLFLFFFFTENTVNGQFNNQWNENVLSLKNQTIERLIEWNPENKSFSTASLKLIPDETSFVDQRNAEFRFTANGREYSGLSHWNVVEVTAIQDQFEGNGMEVILKETEHQSMGIQIKLRYFLYPDLPVIRKQIQITNRGTSEIRIEDLDVEVLNLSVDFTHVWIMHDYARQKALGQFIGNAYDPLSIIHYVREKRGIALGNEAPGVMKRTSANLHPREVTIGLTHQEETFAFRKWLNPGESFISPWTFVVPYSGSSDPLIVLNGPVNDYVRKYMGIRLSRIPVKPVFVYNTWMPFRHDINEDLIKELVDAAAECGIEEFIIDDGWQTNYGDWGIHPEKFPNGLKPVFDYIKQKGMKPGLWISLAAAEKASIVYQQHPEWLVRKSDGSPINLHADFDQMYEWETYSMSMATGWKEYIKSVILNLIEDHGLEYIKGDFAVATGAYTTDKTRSGDHGVKSPFYRDREESMLVLYQKTWELFDELHQAAPELFIDCTFETMGAFQLIDYDMCKHAEGNWLSNFEDPAPFGSLRVRQMSWWRSPVVPATAMVIGNQQLDDPMIDLSIKSLAGSLPILLGDPRKLTSGQRQNIKQFAEWLRSCQEKHNYAMFRQDLKGFGEPQEGNWDGFQRINTESGSGGIVGVFRQGARESQRQVFVDYLDPEKTYLVLEAPSGEEIARMNGLELENRGFLVKFENEYDGALFEITSP